MKVMPLKTRHQATLAWWVVCILLGVLFLLPLYLMVTQAFKSPAEAAAIPPTLWPHSWSLDSFRRMGGEVASINISQHILNSLYVSLATVGAVVLVSTLGGYSFARLNFPGKGVWFFGLLVTFMIPFQAIITPLYLVMRALHLQNSLVGLALVYITYQLPFGLYLMRNAFGTIPREIPEAALLDGCSTLSSLTRVMLPIALPGVVTTALFAFFAAWNDFFAALILVTDQDRMTLPVTLSILQSGQFGTIDWGVLQAGVVVSAIPCVLLFLVLQRYYVSGLLSGALK